MDLNHRACARAFCSAHHCALIKQSQPVSDQGESDHCRERRSVNKSLSGVWIPARIKGDKKLGKRDCWPVNSRASEICCSPSAGCLFLVSLCVPLLLDLFCLKVCGSRGVCVFVRVCVYGSMILWAFLSVYHCLIFLT